MSTANKAQELVERFLGAWNAQDVDRVLGCYTDDVRYRDPNTRGDVEGAAAMRKYLSKLFGKWRMTWTHRESFPLAGEDGYAFLWHATFQKPEGGLVVEADGMDLVVMRGDRIARNEVYFDRAVLAPFMNVG
ncbi:MAG TPA: nuclear transport factor 2 family protein [Polyangiaceae bacterium]|nr:nuclear transport factor 2 family protein [Polyangiaceae bacterium]